jgi:hypothetical protein
MVLVMVGRVVLFSTPFKYWDCGRCEVPAPCIFANKNALWLESAPGDSPKPIYGREMGPTRLISAIFLLLLKPPSPDNGYREYDRL